MGLDQDGYIWTIIYFERISESINHSPCCKKQILLFLVIGRKKKFKRFTSGLPKATRRSFGGQSHPKLLLWRNATPNKNSRYHNGSQSGYGNGKYKPWNLIRQKSAIFSFHSTSSNKIYSSIGKKLIFCKRRSRTSISRKIKTIHRKLETADK